MRTRPSNPEGEPMARRRQDREAMTRARARGLRDTQRRRSPEDEVAVAYHEAGHAVVAVLLGRHVLRVSIVPDDRSSGRVIFPPILADTSPQRADFRSVADRDAVIAIAGDLAVIRHRGTPI